MKLRNFFASSFLLIISFFNRIFVPRANAQVLYEPPTAGVVISKEQQIKTIVLGIISLLFLLFLVFLVIKVIEILVKKIKKGSKKKSNKN